MAQIPNHIIKHAENLAKNYLESPQTDNAGLILRLIVKFIPFKTILKMVAEKVKL